MERTQPKVNYRLEVHRVIPSKNGIDTLVSLSFTAYTIVQSNAHSQRRHDFPKVDTWCKLIVTRTSTSEEGDSRVTTGLTNEFDFMFTHRVYIQTLHLTVEEERVFLTTTYK